MRKYTIVIDEDQRLTLVQAFMALNHLVTLEEDSNDLEAMLRQIAIDEEEDPGTIHDFTL
jgi:hypothetical protein